MILFALLFCYLCIISPTLLLNKTQHLSSKTVIICIIHISSLFFQCTKNRPCLYLQNKYCMIVLPILFMSYYFFIACGINSIVLCVPPVLLINSSCPIILIRFFISFPRTTLSSSFFL